jgi:colanic acid/amylovoran biosynthesis glycosyltransferase
MSGFHCNSGSNNKLRVAYMVSRFPHPYETFVLNEMYWIRKQGVDVCIFSMMDPKPGPVHQRAQEMMDIVHYSPLLSWPLVKANLCFLFRQPVTYLWALLWVIKATRWSPKFMVYMLALFPKSVLFARLMKSSGINHVHAQFAWTQQLAALITSRLLDLSNSVTVHAFELYTRDRRIVRSQLEAADQIVTISENNRHLIADLCQNKSLDDVAVVHLGVDLDQFVPNPKHSDTRGSQLLSVGNLIEKKGHKYLIEACHILAQRCVGFYCSIVGEGPNRPELETLITRYRLTSLVELTGALEQHKVCELYQQSDIFALACVVARSGDRDGMPTVLIEAMASGIPVVTTPVTGIPELVTDGENGILVPERDAGALADALQTLIEDKELRINMGHKARQRVAQDFDIQRNTAVLVDLFHEVANW